MDLPISELELRRRRLMDGQVVLPRLGDVVAGPGQWLPWLVRDCAGCEVDAVSIYLRDRMLGDVSAATCRSYAYDLLLGCPAFSGLRIVSPVML